MDPTLQKSWSNTQIIEIWANSQEKEKWDAEKNKFLFPKNNLNFDITRIGEGTQESVYKLTSNENESYAMKKIRFKPGDKDCQLNFDREVYTLSHFHHPAIIQFIGFNTQNIRKSKYGLIYLKYMENGDLFRKIDKQEEQPFTYSQQLIITLGIASAMEYLHSNNIIHRDLKSENILLDQDFHPYISDFGKSKDVLAINSATRTITGTSLYILSPELLLDYEEHKNSFYIDVYAFGMTIYHLWTGMSPFNGYNNENVFEEDIIEGKRPLISADTPAEIEALITRCWAQEAEARPNFTQIVDYLLSDKFSQSEEFAKYKAEIEAHRPSSRLCSGKSLLEETSESPACHEETEKETDKDAKDSDKSDKETDKSAKEKEKPAKENLLHAIALYESSGREKNVLLEMFHKLTIDLTDSNDISTAEYYCGLISSEIGKYKNAENYFKASRNHGKADAAYQLALLMIDEKIPGGKKQIIENLRTAAENKLLDAILALVPRLLRYTEIEHNKKLAYHFIKEGSNLGNFEMMYKYSKILEYGLKVEDVVSIGEKEAPKRVSKKNQLIKQQKILEDEQTEREKEIKEAMELLKFLAENDYVPAQVDYGLHLLNGYHVPANQEIGESYIELASEKGDMHAKLWNSIILGQSDEPDAESRSNELLTECLQSPELKESFVVYGHNLVQKDYIDASVVDIVKYGMSIGSLVSFLDYGKICEKDPQYGNPEFFFGCAAKRCHAMGDCNFYFPYLFEVFHCEECNVNVCEGCAKTCHKEHTLFPITFENGFNFKCECQEKNADECTAANIGDNGTKISQSCLYQHFYQCETCCPKTNKLYVCRACALKCHAGHKIKDCGIQKGVCACGLRKIPNNFNCKIMPELDQIDQKDCSLAKYFDIPVFQRCFQCLDADCHCCGENEGICIACAMLCHEKHRHIDIGFKEFTCKCLEHKKCKLLG